MFGILEDIVDTAVNVVEKTTNTAVSITTDVTTGNISNATNTVTDVAIQPIKDAAEVVDGLLEGEVRIEAAKRLAVDAVVGASINEVIKD